MAAADDGFAEILIVGAGHGGAAAAIALRQNGFGGSIMLAGAEPELPYERPPLSKDYLAGERAFERMLIRPPAFWRDRDIAIRTDTRIAAIDPERHRATTESGAVIGYRHLIWAAGGEPRRLACPGGDLAGVHSVRTRADIDHIAAELPSVRRVAVIGGGYIGLEAAAVLRKLDRQVVLIEAQPRVLARVAGPALSRFFEDTHRAEGVDLRLDAMVERLVGEGGRVTGVMLADGSEVAADMVIVGIGIAPSVGPLIAAGAKGSEAAGVTVDAQCRTSLAAVHAIGDCARHANRFAGGAQLRLESVQNATDQAAVAARAILNQPVAYTATPWFWSNQYALKLQTVGLSAGYDTELVRGDPASGSFSVVYLRAGRVIALDCVNATRDYVQGRKLIEAGVTADPALIADADRPLKTLLAD